MTEQQYYKAIEQYNQMIEDLQFSPFTHTKDEVFILRDSIKREVRRTLVKMEARLVHYTQQCFRQDYLDELDLQIMRLHRILTDLDLADRPLTDYEGTYAPDPYRYFGFIAVVFVLLGLIYFVF